MPSTLYSILSPTGDEIPLSTSAEHLSPFGLLAGTEGLGLADRELRLSATAARDGGRLRTVRYPPRSATIEVQVDASGAGLTSNLRRLAAAIRPVDGLPLPRLVADVDGTIYEAEFVYESGAQNSAAQPSLSGVTVPLNVIFPDPFWTARSALTFQVSGMTGTDGLLPFLAELRTISSTASGSSTVSNPGDVASVASWRIVGPATLVTASCNGQAWSLGPVSAGEVIEIDGKTKRVTLSGSGTNVYNRVGLAPKFFSIPAGDSAISVAATGASAATLLTCFYRPRLEVLL
jgi:phage-related protein